jgi:hypothetical protein
MIHFVLRSDIGESAPPSPSPSPSLPKPNGARPKHYLGQSKVKLAEVARTNRNIPTYLPSTEVSVLNVASLDWAEMPR